MQKLSLVCVNHFSYQLLLSVVCILAKSGCKPNEASKLVKYALENCKHLNVMGLMTIGKYDNYNEQTNINPDFQSLINCKASVCKELNIDDENFELSMGMSGDFEHAVG